MGFFASKWFIYNQFINLSNPFEDNLFEVVVHCLLIREMIGFSYRDGVSMVSALVCTVTYWIRPMVSLT